MLESILGTVPADFILFRAFLSLKNLLKGREEDFNVAKKDDPFCSSGLDFFSMRSFHAERGTPQGQASTTSSSLFNSSEKAAFQNLASFG